jgi:hypothetical protein
VSASARWTLAYGVRDPSALGSVAVDEIQPLVDADDLHAGASVADESSSAEDCGVAEVALVAFMADLASYPQPLGVLAGNFIERIPNKEAAIAWAIMVGVMAERHRVHRDEHVAREP